MATQTNPIPVINQNQPARSWFIDDIYQPLSTTTTGQYVPNVNDLVWDYLQGWFRVTAVDYTTGASTLTPWALPKAPDQANDLDVLLGAGPGTIADSYRAYIDTTVTPATLVLDRRLHIYGTTANSVKVFLGSDISQNGQVISQYYDASWHLLGENVPLELVGNDPTNLAIKAPKVGYTTTQVADGELLTVVVYDAVGGAVSTAKLIAQNTTFIRQAEASSKYITSITLESPFLSPTDPTIIQYPVNMPVASLNLLGKVSYSDGSTAVLPVDGTKFSLFGLERYIATQQGQELPVVLSYLLSANESNYMGAPSTNTRITREYKAQTLQANNAFSIRLYVFPVWQNPQSGYRLQFYLYNLDRKSVYDVTNLVQAGGNTAAFNPTLYGTAQSLTFALSMDTVDPVYPPFRYVQPMSIALMLPGTNTTGDNWTVQYDPTQPVPYGVGTYAMVTYQSVGNWTVDLTCGLSDFGQWLQKVYYAGQPLVDKTSEVMAPVPNIMAVLIGNTRTELPIESWNQVFTSHIAVPAGSLVTIEWIYRGGANDLQLGVSGLISRTVNPA